MNPTFVYARASFEKALRLIYRYPLNMLARFATFYLLFLVVLVGGEYAVPTALTESLSGIIVGYFLWTMAMTAFSKTAGDITKEAQWGTLEQLATSPIGFGRVVLIKSFVSVCISFLWGVLVLASMLLTTGRTLSVDVVTVLPLATLTLCSAVGLSLIAGGAALLYKRIENLFAIVQFVFIGLIAAPVDASPWLSALPLSLGSHLLRESMASGLRLWELPLSSLGLLVAQAVAWLGVGYLVFRYADGVARRRGILGEY